MGCSIFLPYLSVYFTYLKILSTCFIVILSEDDLQCATWPSSNKYGCSLDEGEDWTVLDEAIFGTAECELLCRQYGTDNGCCFVSDAFGCYWKGGATATNDPGDIALAITCTVRSSS